MRSRKVFFGISIFVQMSHLIGHTCQFDGKTRQKLKLRPPFHFLLFCSFSHITAPVYFINLFLYFFWHNTPQSTQPLSLPSFYLGFSFKILFTQKNTCTFCFFSSFSAFFCLINRFWFQNQFQICLINLLKSHFFVFCASFLNFSNWNVKQLFSFFSTFLRKSQVHFNRRESKKRAKEQNQTTCLF